MSTPDGVMGDDGIIRYPLVNNSRLDVDVEFTRRDDEWHFRYGPADYWKNVPSPAFAAVLDHHHPRPKTVTLQVPELEGRRLVGVVWTRDAEGWTSTEGDSALPHEDGLAVALDALWAAENPDAAS